MKKLSILILILFLINCGGSSGGADPASIPDVSGTYDQTNITAICEGELDTVLEVVQDGANIILQSTHEGFGDAFGTVDADGNFTANTATFECNGTFISGVATAECVSGSVTCIVTYERR